MVVLGLYLFCYNKVFAVTFDESFAKATGVNVSLYNVLIAVLTAITIVIGMRMMGSSSYPSLYQRKEQKRRQIHHNNARARRC